MKITRSSLPAVPLMVHDPYFSYWSFDQVISGSPIRHWTGQKLLLDGFIRIDGTPYSFMGIVPQATPMEQLSCSVLPTSTEYVLRKANVELKLMFLTPILPYKPEILARPVTYLKLAFRSMDKKTHRVEVGIHDGYTRCTDMHVVSQKIVFGKYSLGSAETAFMGSLEQPVLKRSGDGGQIDWGYQHLVIPSQFQHRLAFADDVAYMQYVEKGLFPESDLDEFPSQGLQVKASIVCSLTLDVINQKKTSVWLAFAYNDMASIEFLQQRLPGYWTRQHSGFNAMLKAAVQDFPELEKECAAFDRELCGDAEKLGGPDYATLLSAAYRQAFGAHKTAVKPDGTLMFFSKENFSGGMISTVDVTYPSAPLFLLMNPVFIKGMLLPVLEYAQTANWKFPFAPHDLGRYPIANAQVYGGAERTVECQMPVEECGNMLILAAAYWKYSGDLGLLRQYWELFTKWANYLLEKGYDPENQLCTDDFAGHLAHNANLSIKAILALGAYAQMSKAIGRKNEADKFLKKAASFAKRWVKEAASGDHYVLAFDQKDSWSQKYNLVWDQLLNLNLFPQKVIRTEMAFYRSHLQKYGLPLDSRKTYTKLDWIYWTACLSGTREDFDAITAPVMTWLGETPDKVPMTDYFETTDGKHCFFQARSVVGGLFLKFLYNPEICQKWLSKIGIVKNLLMND